MVRDVGFEWGEVNGGMFTSVLLGRCFRVEGSFTGGKRGAVGSTSHVQRGLKDRYVGGSEES